MDHWRLDDNDAAFEDERQERDKQQRAEAARLHEESSQFYRLARASQERTIDTKPAPASSSLARLAEKRKPQQQAQRLSCVKVVKTMPQPNLAQPVTQPAAATPAPAVAVLPGMAAYDDDSGSSAEDEE